MLDRSFEALAPNRKWIADFTYVWTAEGWLYVAAVVDLFSRRVVGWSMSAAMTAQLAFGRQERQDSAGVRAVRRSPSCSASSRIWRSVARRVATSCSAARPAVVLHFALVEAHRGILTGRLPESIVLFAGPEPWSVRVSWPQVRYNWE